MKALKKVLKWSFICTAGLAVTLTLLVVVLERRAHDVPLPPIAASSDPVTIARGRYLVYGPGHCIDCHGDPARRADFQSGKDGPLSGGVEFHLPIGTIRTPNITPDVATGIGGVSDGALARALRHGVRRDGRTLAPFMPFADLSDEDLTAVISFLRAQPPVNKPVVTRELNVLGHVVNAFVLQPKGPSGPVAATSPIGATVERGRYLVNSVAGCASCHTRRDMRTGAMIGEPLAGGLEMESHSLAGRKFVSPNLTPDVATGRITNWTEEIFVARVRTGKGADGTPMPWPSYARMTDEDLAAIYRYLRSLPAVNNPTGDSVRPVTVASASASAGVSLDQ